MTPDDTTGGECVVYRCPYVGNRIGIGVRRRGREGGRARKDMRERLRRDVRTVVAEERETDRQEVFLDGMFGRESV